MLQGSLDDVRLYNRALPEAEVDALVAMGTVSDTTPPTAPTNLRVVFP
jgi:hypothetical protein